LGHGSSETFLGRMPSEFQINQAQSETFGLNAIKEE